MILNLDHAQRLNLINLLDLVECPGRREAWEVCALQEELDLSDEERSAIGWKTQRTQDGRELVLWDSTKFLPARPFDLNEDDVSRICRALDKYTVVLARDRGWWKPLTAQLPSPVETNGDKP